MYISFYIMYQPIKAYETEIIIIVHTMTEKRRKRVRGNETQKGGKEIYTKGQREEGE